MTTIKIGLLNLYYPGYEKCYVPHPEYYLEEHESCHFPSGETKAKYLCKACNKEFIRQWNYDQGLGTARVVDGKMWCFKVNPQNKD